jgi:hypothetical protein
MVLRSSWNMSKPRDNHIISQRAPGLVTSKAGRSTGAPLLETAGVIGGVVASLLVDELDSNQYFGGPLLLCQLVSLPWDSNAYCASRDTPPSSVLPSA